MSLPEGGGKREREGDGKRGGQLPPYCGTPTFSVDTTNVQTSCPKQVVLQWLSRDTPWYHQVGLWWCMGGVGWCGRQYAAVEGGGGGSVSIGISVCVGGSASVGEARVSGRGMCQWEGHVAHVPL